MEHFIEFNLGDLIIVDPEPFVISLRLGRVVTPLGGYSVMEDNARQLILDGAGCLILEGRGQQVPAKFDPLFDCDFLVQLLYLTRRGHILEAFHVKDQNGR